MVVKIHFNHATEDDTFAQRLAAELSHRDYEVVRSGDYDIMICIFSRAFLASTPNSRALDQALSAGAKIIPIIYQDYTIPGDLLPTIPIDFSQQPYEKGLEQLLQELKVQNVNRPLQGIRCLDPLEIDPAYLEQRHDIEAALRRLAKGTSLPPDEPGHARHWLLNDPEWAPDLPLSWRQPPIEMFAHYLPPLLDEVDLVNRIRVMLGVNTSPERLTFESKFTHTCIIGPVGCGKSSLLAYWYLTHADLPVVYHTLDDLPRLRSESLAEILYTKIKRRFGLTDEVAPTHHATEQIKNLLQHLQRRQLAGTVDTPLVLIIDGLDVEEKSTIEKLLAAWPASFHYRLLTSCNERWQEELLDLGLVPEEGILGLPGLPREQAKKLLACFLGTSQFFEKEWEEILTRAQPESETDCYDPECLQLIGRYLQDTKWDQARSRLEHLPQKSLMKHRFLFDLYTRNQENLPVLSEHRQQWQTQLPGQQYSSFIKSLLALLAVIPEGIPQEEVVTVLRRLYALPQQCLEELLEQVCHDLTLLLPVLRRAQGRLHYHRHSLFQSFWGFLDLELLENIRRELISWCEQVLGRPIPPAWPLRNLPELYEDTGQQEAAARLLRSPRFLELRATYGWQIAAHALDTSIAQLEQMAREVTEEASYPQPTHPILTPEGQALSTLVMHRQALLRIPQDTALYIYHVRSAAGWRTEAPFALSHKRTAPRLIWPDGDYADPPLGHSAAVSALALDISGEALLSTSLDGSLRLWQLVTRELQMELQLDEGGLLAVAWHPGGRLAIAGGFNGQLQVLDLVRFQAKALVSDHDDSIVAVAIDPDGNLILAGDEDGRLYLWDLHRCECLGTMAGHDDLIWDITIHPNGRVAISAGADGTLHLWDLLSRKKLGTMQVEDAEILTVAIHPGGRFALCGADNGNLYWWNLRECECRGVLSAHQEKVNSLAIHFQGRLGYSAGADGTVRLWDLKTQKLLRTLPVAEEAVEALACHQESRLVIVGTAQGEIATWDLAESRCVGRISGLAQQFTCVALAPNSTTALSVDTDQCLCQRDVPAGSTRTIYVDDTLNICALALIPDGQRCLAGDSDHRLTLWDLQRGEQLSELSGHQKAIKAIAVAATGAWAISSGEEPTVYCWDLREQRCCQKLAGHQGGVYAVAVDQDYALSGGEDGQVRFWQPLEGKLVATLAGHRTEIGALALRFPWALSGADDGMICLWDLRQQECQQQYCATASPIQALAWHPHKDLFLSGSRDGCLQVWDLQHNQFRKMGFCHRPVLAITFLDENQFIVASDVQIQIWRLG